MSYHVTTDISAVKIDLFTQAATKQEDKVLAFFAANPAQAFSPSQVWKALFSEATPLQSVRRAITDLTADGKLVKINNATTAGVYGHPEHLWRIK